MTVTDRAGGTRHLVDPEALAALDAYQQLTRLLPPTAETLPAVRQMVNQPVPGAPDPAALFPGVSRSARAVPGLSGNPDVPVLVYSPAARATPAPALIWIHGGGFIMGSAAGDDLTCRRSAAQTAAVVVSPDYRLAPETPFPGPVHDCYAVLQWVLRNAAELGVDPARIAVGGASAGGGLAACLAILARDRGECPVSFQLLVYPMLDDRTASTADPGPCAGEFIWTPAANRFSWASLLGGEPGGENVSPYASAARVESVAGLPPTFISVGSLDLFTQEDIGYAQRLIHAGIPTELHVYPGGYHGFNIAAGARITQAFQRDMLSALARHLNG